MSCEVLLERRMKASLLLYDAILWTWTLNMRMVNDTQQKSRVSHWRKKKEDKEEEEKEKGQKKREERKKENNNVLSVRSILWDIEEYMEQSISKHIIMYDNMIMDSEKNSIRKNMRIISIRFFYKIQICKIILLDLD